jgi:hypothetical protein
MSDATIWPTYWIWAYAFGRAWKDIAYCVRNQVPPYTTHRQQPDLGRGNGPTLAWQPDFIVPQWPECEAGEGA